MTPATPTADTPANPTPAEPGLSRRDYVRAVRRMTAAVVALGVIARVFRYALGAAIWNDEAGVGLNLLRRDFEGLTHALDELQVAPILFLWTERAMLLLLGSSEYVMRLVPFLLGLGGLFLFWDFARRVVPKTPAALAVACLAAARWPVTMSSTLKPYTADLFWSALLMALAARWRQRPERLWPLAGLAVAVPFALGMSYPTVFVAGAVCVYLLPAVRRHPDRRAAVLFAAYALAMFAAFAAVYALVQWQRNDPQSAALRVFMRDYWAHGFPPGDPPGFLWWLVKIHTGRMFAIPWGDNNGGSTLPFLAFALGVWAAWRSGERALVALCLTPFALNFAASVAGQYPYGGCTRLSQHLAPAICLMVGVGLARVADGATDLAGKLRRVRVWFGLLALLGVVQMVFDACDPHRDEAARWNQRIGRELARHLRPGDEVAYRRHLAGTQESTDWYIARLGGVVSWDGPPVTSPDTRRVWLVVLTVNSTGEKEEGELLAALGPGWVTAARVEYLVKPYSNVYRHGRCTVHCLARTPLDPADRPLLQASP